MLPVKVNMQKTSPLLRLPQEILDEIVKQAAIQSKAILVHRNDDDDDDDNGQKSFYAEQTTCLLGPALTCRKLSSTYLQSLYTSNTFCFPSGLKTAFTHFATQVGPQTVNRIASLDFSYLPSDQDWNALWRFANLRSLALYIPNTNWAGLYDEPLDPKILEKITQISKHFQLLRTLSIEVDKYNFDCYHTPFFGRGFPPTEVTVDAARSTLQARNPDAKVHLRESHSFQSPVGPGGEYRRDGTLQQVTRLYVSPGVYAEGYHRNAQVLSFDPVAKRVVSRYEDRALGAQALNET